MDDFDDIIDKIKKYFKLDSDIFDVDFLFIPESEKGINFKPNDKNVKGFKISYHFETGMKKPEIKIKGNVDEKQIRDYLKNVDISRYPTLKKLFDASSTKEIDVNTLSLDFPEQDNDLQPMEPHTEINDYKDYSEVVFDVPGMSEEDIIFNISESGKRLNFSAKNAFRTYSKSITLPFKSTNENCDLEVKNGLAIISIQKKTN
jgi:HSP20 family molecular chaperone IbpA